MCWHTFFLHMLSTIFNAEAPCKKNGKHIQAVILFSDENLWVKYTSGIQHVGGIDQTYKTKIYSKHMYTSNKSLTHKVNLNCLCYVQSRSWNTYICIWTVQLQVTSNGKKNSMKMNEHFSHLHERYHSGDG